MKCCITWNVPVELGNMLAAASAKACLNVNDAGVIPTGRGIPLHMTLRAPGSCSKQTVHTVRSLLQDLPTSELRIRELSSFPEARCVVAKVDVCPFWLAEFDARMEDSPFGLGRADKRRTPHITLVKGLGGRAELDATIDAIKYWTSDWSVMNRPYPVDQLVIYCKQKGESKWTAASKVNLADARSTARA